MRVERLGSGIRGLGFWVLGSGVRGQGLENWWVSGKFRIFSPCSPSPPGKICRSSGGPPAARSRRTARDAAAQLALARRRSWRSRSESLARTGAATPARKPSRRWIASACPVTSRDLQGPHRASHHQSRPGSRGGGTSSTASPRAQLGPLPTGTFLPPPYPRLLPPKPPPPWSRSAPDRRHARMGWCGVLAGPSLGRSGGVDAAESRAPCRIVRAVPPRDSTADSERGVPHGSATEAPCRSPWAVLAAEGAVAAPLQCACV